MDKIFKEIERKLSTVYDTTNNDNDESILSFLSREFAAACQQHFSDLASTEEREVAVAALWGMVNYLNFHCGDDAALCSARQYGPYEDLPGPQNLRVPGGMRNIFRGLRDSLGEDGVVTGKKVVSVVATDSNAVRVECADGSIYDADVVIVTVSLGYLKNHHKEMFTPPLPVRVLLTNL